MAVQSPPSPVAPGYTPVPPAKKSGCAGCGLGCFGCVGVFVVLALLIAGGGWYFVVVQAQAGIPAPAALVVFSTPVDVGRNDSGYRSAIPGEPLTAGNSVRTGNAGHAAIQFPDGSFIRMSPETTVSVTSPQLNKDGTLQSPGLQQQDGRTRTNVQRLPGDPPPYPHGHPSTPQLAATHS